MICSDDSFHLDTPTALLRADATPDGGERFRRILSAVQKSGKELVRHDPSETSSSLGVAGWVRTLAQPMV